MPIFIKEYQHNTGLPSSLQHDGVMLAVSYLPSSSGEGQRDLVALPPSRSGVGRVRHAIRQTDTPHPNPSPEEEGLRKHQSAS